MKRIMIYGLMIVLMIAMVSAQNVVTKDQSRMEINEQIQSLNQIRNSSVDGLEMLQIRANSQEEARFVDQVMERLTTQERLSFSNMKNVSLSTGQNNTVVIQANEQARLFGLFNVNRNSNFIVNEEGQIERINRPLDILFRYQVFGDN